MRLAEPLDQATGLRRLFAAEPAFHSVGVLGPDPRRNARACAALAQGLSRRGASVLVLDEALPPYNVAGMLGRLARPSEDDWTQLALPEASMDAGEGLRILAAAEGSVRLAGMSEQALHALTELWRDDAPEWMLLSGRDGMPAGGLASTADARVLVLPGDKRWLAEGYALLKAGHAMDPRGQWLVLVEGVEHDSAQRFHASLCGTTQRFIGVTPLFLGCLPHRRESDESLLAGLLAESLQSLQTESALNFEQYWQRLWLFSRMSHDAARRKVPHAGRHAR